MTARPRVSAVLRVVRRHPSTALVALVTAGFAACVGTGAGGAVFERDLSDIATFLIAAAAGLACLIRAYGRPGRMRWAWIGIGLGALSYSFGEASWTWMEMV